MALNNINYSIQYPLYETLKKLNPALNQGFIIWLEPPKSFEERLVPIEKSFTYNKDININDQKEIVEYQKHGLFNNLEPLLQIADSNQLKDITNLLLQYQKLISLSVKEFKGGNITIDNLDIKYNNKTIHYPAPAKFSDNITLSLREWKDNPIYHFFSLWRIMINNIGTDVYQRREDYMGRLFKIELNMKDVNYSNEWYDKIKEGLADNLSDALPKIVKRVIVYENIFPDSFSDWDGNYENPALVDHNITFSYERFFDIDIVELHEGLDDDSGTLKDYANNINEGIKNFFNFNV